MHAAFARASGLALLLLLWLCLFNSIGLFLMPQHRVIYQIASQFLGRNSCLQFSCSKNTMETPLSFSISSICMDVHITNAYNLGRMTGNLFNQRELSYHMAPLNVYKYYFLSSIMIHAQSLNRKFHHIRETVHGYFWLQTITCPNVWLSIRTHSAMVGSPSLCAERWSDECTRLLLANGGIHRFECGQQANPSNRLRKSNTHCRPTRRTKEKREQENQSHLWVITALPLTDRPVCKLNTHTKWMTQKTVQVIIDVMRIIQFIGKM